MQWSPPPKLNNRNLKFSLVELVDCQKPQQMELWGNVNKIWKQPS